MNRVKKSDKKKKGSDKVRKEKSSGKISAARKYIRFFGLFNIMKTENLLRSMPFIFFLTFIAIIYIANSYMAEKTIRRIDSMNKELKTLRSEHISGKSELMFRSKQSEVAREVATLGIKESVEAPKKIVVNTEETAEEDN